MSNLPSQSGVKAGDWTLERKRSITSNEKNLIRRYLVWGYKTTKESLDRVDRKFTQLMVDDYVLHQLEKKTWTTGIKLKEFKQYIINKRQEALQEKFADQAHTVFNPSYEYLQNRYRALERAIVYFLGKAELKRINKLYEQEMTQRILQAREHA